MGYQDNDEEPLDSLEIPEKEPENVEVSSGDTEQDVEYISKEGYAKLKSELETLKTKERLHIAERLEYAKSLGDLSENAEFDAAKEEQMLNEMRISELEHLLRRATVVAKHSSSSTVGIGSTLSVHVGVSDSKEIYTIVGSSEEADPLAGHISHESPLGRAFFGRKKGEHVIVATPRGDVKYVIVEIS